MERKTFIQNSLIAAVSLTGINSFATKRTFEKPFKLNYAFHEGMFENYAGKNFLDQIKYGYDMGFRAIEDNGMMDRLIKEQEAIGNLLAKLDMKMGVFVLNFDRWPVKTSLTSGSKEWKEKFKTACINAIEVAKRCNAKWITVVPGNFDRSLPHEIQTANVIETLRTGCDILEPKGLIMVLEALSDTPDLFLRNSDQTYMICKAVNRPSCKFLFDMYHMQRNEGNIIKNLEICWSEIAYLQIGDNPGRNEPDTGEMNYKNIFRWVKKKGFQGILGMEHGLSEKGKAGEDLLVKSYRDADI